MECFSRTSLLHLDDLAIRHIIDHLDLRDVRSLCATSKALCQLLNDMYTISLSFPLDSQYMTKDEAEKPVLEIITNGKTDKDCESNTNTNKQIGKINMGNLKLLWLQCPSQDDEICVNSCSNYHQRILYNLYHRHWKRGTSFNLQRLSVTVSEKVRRLSQVLTAMPSLREVDLYIPIKLDEHTTLIEDVCSHPSMRKLSVTVLLNPDHLRGFSLKLKSGELEDLSIAGAVGLPITKLELPKLERFTFLPQGPQEINKLLTGDSRVVKKGFNGRPIRRYDFTDPIERFKLMHKQCPSLQFYNDVFIGDICRESCKEWTKNVAERMKIWQMNDMQFC